MEQINTDYKRQIWKIKAKLFNMRKPWLSPFKEDFPYETSYKKATEYRGVVSSSNLQEFQDVLP